MQRALRLWTVEGSVATIWGTFVGGAFQTGFALYLGCSEFIIGALAAIPAFAGLLQLFSSYYAQRYGNRKQIVIWSAIVGRLLWIPMLLIPFTLPKPLWVGVFLILTVLSNALLNIGGPLWTAWISDLVPRDYRGRYFGQRNMYAGLVGMIASIVGGLFIDHATKQATMSQPVAFGILFAVASVFACCSFFLGSRSPDVEQPKGNAADAPVAGGALRYYASPFQDRNFRSIMLYNAILAVATGVAGQFFTVYQLKFLRYDYTVMQLLGAVASLAGLGTMPLWGYLADKYGNKPILAICNVMVLAAPFMWLATTPDNFPGLWTVAEGGHVIVSFSKLDICALNLISGAAWAGVGLTQFNMMIGLAPPEKRTVYVSAVSATTGIVGGVAPLLGGAIITAMAETHFPAHGLARNAYHVVFLVSAFFRAIALLLLQPIREEGSNTTRYVIEQLRATKPLASFRSINKLSKGGSMASRQAAAEQLASIRTPVAVEELVRALDDVALPVREQAARALGEIGDERAVAPLVSKLADPSSGITNAAATALGKIGSADALPSLAAAAQLGPLSRQLAALEALGRIDDDRVSTLLVSLATDADAAIRSAAIRALIEREDPATGNVLAVILDRETDPATVTTLADALGRVGSLTALEPLLRALDKVSTPIARRSAINAVGSIVGGRDSLYPYLALEAFARDEVVSRTLMSVQRRLQSRAKRGNLPNAARMAARARQALEAYAAGHLSECLSRLRNLTDLIEVSERNEPVRRVLRWLDNRREGKDSEVETEEVLLAVFLVRMVTE